MRFRLDEQHYADDRLLEPGMEVGDGDGTVHPWRWPSDVSFVSNKTGDDGTIRPMRVEHKAGEAMPPSKSMTPKIVSGASHDGKSSFTCAATSAREGSCDAQLLTCNGFDTVASGSADLP